MNPLFFAILLVMTLAAYVFFFLKLRQMERSLGAANAALDELRRRNEVRAADGDRVRDALSSLNATVVEVQREIGEVAATIEQARIEVRAADERGVETLRRVEELADARAADAAIASAVEPEVEAVPAAPSAVDLARRHLESLGLTRVQVDGTAVRADGREVVRARAFRGTDLWHGRVVVNGSTVESEAELGMRMFP